MLRENHAKLIQLATFSSSIHFASHCNINLKAKQVSCLDHEALYFGKDGVAVLPTGYVKLMILHLLPSLCYDKISIGRTAPSSSVHDVVIVVSTLNELMKGQI